MQNENLKEWWTNEGCIRLNEVMVEFVGEKIGFVPLANLLGDYADITLFDQDELTELLSEDGCYVRTQLMSGGEKTLLIYIK